jgi:hypothetical protein
MEMDVYDLDSYQLSIGNLLMLKLFHDQGIDVSTFSNPIVHVNWDIGACLEIFFDGLNRLFANVYSYREEPSKGANYDDVFDESFEDIIIIQDPVFEKVLHGPDSKIFEHKLNAQLPLNDLVKFNYCEAALEVLPDRTGIAVIFHFALHHYEVVRAIINLREFALDLIKNTESGYYEVPNHHNRQSA